MLLLIEMQASDNGIQCRKSRPAVDGHYFFLRISAIGSKSTSFSPGSLDFAEGDKACTMRSRSAVSMQRNKVKWHEALIAR